MSQTYYESLTLTELRALHVKLCTDFNSFFVVRRSVLEALGGFDDSMKLVFADADFVDEADDVAVAVRRVLSA